MITYISSIRLKNYQCYTDAEFNLKQTLTVVTGCNAGGKTAFLKALQLFCSPNQKAKLEDFRLAVLNSDERHPEMEIIGEFSCGAAITKVRRKFSLEGLEVSDLGYERLELAPADENLRCIQREWRGYKAGEQSAVLTQLGIKPGKNTTERFKQIEDHIEASLDGAVEIWCKFDPKSLLPTIQIEDPRDPKLQIEGVLRSFIKSKAGELRSNEAYQTVSNEISKEANLRIKELRETFRRYDPTAADLNIDVEVDIARGVTIANVHLDKQVGNHGHTTVPLENLGDAKRKKMQLALLEWQAQLLQESEHEEATIVVYDEPDAHFDYNAQRKLLSTLRKIAEQPNCQVLVVTHSLVLIDRLDLSSIMHLRHFDKEDEVPCSKVMTPQSWPELSVVARSLGLKNHHVLNSCLLLMEGVTEVTLIPKLFEKLRGYELESIGVQIVSDSQGTRGGKGHVWTFGSYMLQQGSRVFLVLDNDARLQTSGVRRVITQQGINDLNAKMGGSAIQEGKNLAFLGEKELEDIFSDEAFCMCIKNLFYDIPSITEIPTEELTTTVSAARRSGLDLKNALRKHVKGLLPKDKGAKLVNRISKPQLASSLANCLDEDHIPLEIVELFNQLESYAEA